MMPHALSPVPGNEPSSDQHADPASPIASLTSAVAALATTDWSTVEPATALAAVEDLVRAQKMLDAALALAAERCDKTDAAAAAGWASMKDYLVHLTGGYAGAGASILRLAERLRELPAVRDALIAGDVSAAQARVIGRRIATLPRDQALRDRATQIMLRRVRDHADDATALDRGFPAVIDEVDPDRQQIRDDLEREKAERAVHHERFLTFSEDAVGGVRIRGYTTVEEAELVKSCLFPLAAPQSTAPGACGGSSPVAAVSDERAETCESLDVSHPSAGCPDPRCLHDGRDPRQSGARTWDALVEVCRRLQCTDDLPRSHGAAARLIVTIPLDDLEGRVGGRGLLPDGESLSVSAVRRLACDAEVIPAVLGEHSEILDLGRSHRLVNPALWTALVIRDRHCTFPGCRRLPVACDAHHIVHWINGGKTELDNMMLVCRRHHTVAHHSPWTVSLDPQTHRPAWAAPRGGSGGGLAAAWDRAG